jgi:hypothetical protein
MTRSFAANLRRSIAVPIGLLLAVLASQAVSAPAGRPDARPQGKPTAPIAMHYEISGDAGLGQAIAVTVSFTPEQPLDNATVRLSADEALVLVAPPGGLEFGSVPAGREIRVVVGVTPLALAVLRLNVSVAGSMHGEAQSRNLSIPIRLGPAAKTPAVLKREAGGQLVHSLPTQGPARGSRR